jgi:hypothetical protein
MLARLDRRGENVGIIAVTPVPKSEDAEHGMNCTPLLRRVGRERKDMGDDDSTADRCYIGWHGQCLSKSTLHMLHINCEHAQDREIESAQTQVAPQS